MHYYTTFDSIIVLYIHSYVVLGSAKVVRLVFWNHHRKHNNITSVTVTSVDDYAYALNIFVRCAYSMYWMPGRRMCESVQPCYTCRLLATGGPFAVVAIRIVHTQAIIASLLLDHVGGSNHRRKPKATYTGVERGSSMWPFKKKTIWVYIPVVRRFLNQYLYLVSPVLLNY